MITLAILALSALPTVFAIGVYVGRNKERRMMRGQR
jgi:hypothetical protein